jgi:hypothetical protein
VLATCEIAEISLFEDRLWTNAKPETCILIGRRRSSKTKISSVMYRRVRNRDMEVFKSDLIFSREDHLAPSELGRGDDVDLYEPDLRELWQYLASAPKLGTTFDVQQGFQLKAKEILGARAITSSVSRAGFTKAIFNASDDYTVWELPKPEWVDLRPSNVRRPGAATILGKPQLVINYAGPVKAWRFKPVVDREGIAVSSRFLAIRPRESAQHSLMTLWAVLASPMANAFAYCWSSKRQTLVKEWLKFPLPSITPSQKAHIEIVANAYLKVAIPPHPFTLTPPNESAIQNALLELDAAVLRLYDLPPEMEQYLLEIFDGVERPGVGCTFRSYPPAWSSRPVGPSIQLPTDGRPIWERIASLAKALPEQVIAGLPTDGAAQLDHYLYGTPKRKR